MCNVEVNAWLEGSGSRIFDIFVYEYYVNDPLMSILPSFAVTSSNYGGQHLLGTFT